MARYECYSPCHSKKDAHPCRCEVDGGLRPQRCLFYQGNDDACEWVKVD